MSNKNLTDKVIKAHSFVINPKSNGGENLVISTKFIHNGDDGPEGIYVNQEITLNSYSNAASFLLFGTSLDPVSLRKLADQLDRARVDAERLKAKMEADLKEATPA